MASDIPAGDVKIANLFYSVTVEVGNLNAEEGGEDDVAEDDEVDLVEEAAEHQDHEDQVHDGKHPHRHSLRKAVQDQVGWHTTDLGPT